MDCSMMPPSPAYAPPPLLPALMPYCACASLSDASRLGISVRHLASSDARNSLSFTTASPNGPSSASSRASTALALSRRDAHMPSASPSAARAGSRVLCSHARSRSRGREKG